MPKLAIEVVHEQGLPLPFPPLLRVAGQFEATNDN
jgi:hypothetical protein